MQFVPNGPDVPEHLLHAHEDGRVVFFCGAGISRSAGLPDFESLVEKLYLTLAVEQNEEQRAAVEAKQFDFAIHLLEKDIIGGRKRVRSELAKILTPDLSAENATATHEALLMLSKSRQGSTRIITTNFDRLFQEVIATKGLDIQSIQAPQSPRTRWDGLVYLHGLLSEAPTESELEHLVISSSDFGNAYLNDGRAARFVSDSVSKFYRVLRRLRKSTTRCCAT